MKTDEEIICDLYCDYWRYMIEKDAEGLRSIMSDDYYLMHMTGVRQSRDEFLKGLLGGTFNYYSADHDGIEIQINGNTASMIGKSCVSAAVYGGGKHTWRLRGDFTLRKENDGWIVTSSAVSTY